MNTTSRKNPANVATVDAGRHLKLKVRANPGHEHAREQNLAPITLSELAVCIANFPVAFVQRPDDGSFVLTAMLGLRGGENVYYGPEYWESTHIPLSIQRHPFLIGFDDRLSDRDELTTCIETGSPWLSETDGVPLFDDAGEQSDFLKSRHQLLNGLFESQKVTDRFVQAVTGLGLIKPFDLLLQVPDGKTRRAGGLFTLDERLLKQLDATQIKALHDQDFLAPCYLILASLHQLGSLIRLGNRQGRDPVVNFRIEFKDAASAPAA